MWFCLRLSLTLGDKNVNFIAFGPGLESADLIFPSRYLFVLSRVKFDKIELRHRDGQSKDNKICQPWTHVYKNTKFCLRLRENQTIIDSITQDNLGKLFGFCEVGNDHDDRDYHLSIVRYSLYGQMQCKLNGLELVVLDEIGDILYRQTVKTIDDRDMIYSEKCTSKHLRLNTPNNLWTSQMQCNSKTNQNLAKQITSDLK